MPSWRPPTPSPPWWRGLTTALVCIALAVAIAWSRPWQVTGLFPRLAAVRPSGSAEQAVATVEAVQAGHRGKYGPTFFTYKVRLDDSLYADMTLSLIHISEPTRPY